MKSMFSLSFSLNHCLLVHRKNKKDAVVTASFEGTSYPKPVPPAPPVQGTSAYPKPRPPAPPVQGTSAVLRPTQNVMPGPRLLLPTPELPQLGNDSSSGGDVFQVSVGN